MNKVLDAAKKIKLFVTDVDGVLTHGQIIYDSRGNETKHFHVHDGLGLKLLQNAGITVAIISARQSNIVSQRAKELNIQHVFQGFEDKRQVLLDLLTKTQTKPDEAAYIGDDLMDLALIRFVGLGITVPNGHNSVREQADWQTLRPGGEGAVRECCDLILRAQGKLTELTEKYSQWLD